MRRILKERVATALVVVIAMIIASAATAGAASLITGKQIKDGSIGARDLTKAVRQQLACAGVPGPQGPAGAKGETGAKGDPGPTLIRHTQNAESGFPISATPTTVAVIGEISEALYSGSYSGGLVHPTGLTAYMVVNIQAHVRSVTGTGPFTCTLENRADGGPWTPIAQAVAATAGTELFMNPSFPSFTAGTTWSFRVRCNTNSGSGTARGEIGVVAGPVV